MLIKRFLEWIGIKRQLDEHMLQSPFVREGELWWCSIGENVGVEVSGKGRNFTRPVIVLKRFGRDAFFGIPLTTRRRDGDWYCSFQYAGIQEYAMLSQGRFLSCKRLQDRMGELDEDQFAKAKEAFASLFR